jgi:hypothetical protein
MVVIEFREHSTLGAGTYTIVRQGDRRIGGIYQASDALYRFHLGNRETLGPAELSAPNLELLKEKIRTRFGG